MGDSCIHPVVSIVIVNWNTAALLRNCLASLPVGCAGTAYETFVVDNGSTDGSQQMVRAEFPYVRLIENGRNLGFAAANNVALRQARGEFFLLLNSDTVLTAGCIDRLVEHMRADPTCGFCGPQLLNEDGSNQNSVANFPCLATELCQKSLLRLLFPRRFCSRNMAVDGPVVVESLVGAALLARREMTDQIGFYDEAFFFFFEETEWCLRGALAGWTCVFLPQAKVYHLQGQTAKKVRIPVRIEYWRSRYTYFRKYYSPPKMLLLTSVLLLRACVKLGLNAPLSPFSRGARERVGLCSQLLLWHLRGLPAQMGLSAAQAAGNTPPAHAPAPATSGSTGSTATSSAEASS